MTSRSAMRGRSAAATQRSGQNRTGQIRPDPAPMAMRPTSATGARRQPQASIFAIASAERPRMAGSPG